MNRYKRIKYFSILTVIKDAILALLKIVLGKFGQSHALVADGVHSLSDLLIDGMVLIAAKFGSKKADEDHPYGHSRIETVASLGLAAFLILVGLSIIFDAVQDLVQAHRVVSPKAFVLWIALFSFLINEIIYRAMKREGERIQSDLLIANAIHSRSDAASSLIVLIGIAGSLLGLAYLDELAAIVVGLLIIRTGAILVWKNLSELVDVGLDPKDLLDMKRIILKTSEVRAIHELKTRRMAGRILVDVHIIVDPRVTVSEGHHISEQVMTDLKQEMTGVDQVMVHIDSENDEAYSSTARLPLRGELWPELEKVLRGLPGFIEKPLIRFHYLNGEIEIEIELSSDLLKDHSVESLTDEYRNALRSYNYIRLVKLLFV